MKYGRKTVLEAETKISSYYNSWLNVFQMKYGEDLSLASIVLLSGEWILKIYTILIELAYI